jgi:hypothetical protein
LLNMTPVKPNEIKYERLWPQVLARHVIRKTDVNQMAARLRNEQRLMIPNWEKGKRVPQTGYRIQRLEG